MAAAPATTTSAKRSSSKATAWRSRCRSRCCRWRRLRRLGRPSRRRRTRSRAAAISPLRPAATAAIPTRAWRAALCRRAGARNPRSAPSFTPNITPDRETGIGGWSRRRFHRGRCAGASRPDDSHYLPAFPFAFLQSPERARPRRSRGVSRQPAGGAPAQPRRLIAPFPFAARGAADRRCDSRFPGPVPARPDAATRYGIAAPIWSPRSAAAAIATRRATGSARPIRSAFSPARRPARRQEGARTSRLTPRPASAIGARRHRRRSDRRAYARFRFRRRRDGRDRQEHRPADDADRRAIAVYLAIAAAGPFGIGRSAKKD